MESSRTNISITGSSPETKRLKRTVRKFAKVDKNILLVGDVGTGKRHAARIIHQLSSRRDNPFIILNCSALGYTIDRKMLLGEVNNIGYSQEFKTGILDKVENGVLYLDNLAETPQEYQIFLTQILQEHKFRREGSSENITLDIRVISAAVQKPDAKIKSGKFHKDLYLLLNPLTIYLPQLKTRIRDIPELMLFFLKEYCIKHQLEMPAVPAEIFEAIMEHDWKGNIRELKDCVENLVMMSPQRELSLQYLPFDIERNPLDCLEVNNINKVVAEVERYLINQSLNKFAGNQVKAAKLLGIPEATLRFKIKKYAIPKRVAI